MTRVFTLGNARVERLRSQLRLLLKGEFTLYTEKAIFLLMKNYQKLNPQKTSIINFLHECDVFEGGYTDLAEAMGIAKKNAPNIRKALIKLDEMGIVCIVRQPSAIYDDDGNVVKSAPMKACFLVDGWMNVLLNAY